MSVVAMVPRQIAGWPVVGCFNITVTRISHERLEKCLCLKLSAHEALTTPFQDTFRH